MNRVVFTIIFWMSLLINANAQSFNCVIVDKISRSPLPFANVGFIGKNVGTVTNENGQFSLKQSNFTKYDTLKISYVGYEPILMSNIIINSDLEQLIELNPICIELNEVFVHPKKYKEVILGNKIKWNKIVGYFISDMLGSEIGTLIKLKNRALLEELRFNIVKCTYDSLVFRVNIYDYKDDLPKDNLLMEPIYIRPENRTGLAIIDLSKYKIWLDDDFIISIEYFRKLGTNDKHIGFSCGLLNNDSFQRIGSQGKWYRLQDKGMNIGFGLHVKMKREK